jgi:tetratricopeptide (TPR) repeat protein
MHKHDNCCDRKLSHKERSDSWYRWLLTISFVGLSFVLMLPFTLKQLLSRAASYATNERYDDAVRMYKRVLLFDKRNAHIWDLLGYSYQSGGNIEKAISSYRQAIRLDPENKSSRLSLGLILISQKEYREAVSYFEQIRALGPQKRGPVIDVFAYHKSSLKLLVTCYESLKEFNKRDKALEELRRYYPEDNMMLEEARSRRLLKQ